jgi:hypothetical protein
MRFLRGIFRPCRRTREASRELPHEDCFDCCTLSAGADVHGLWAERVPSLYPPAATGESIGAPVLCCRQRIALCRVLLFSTGYEVSIERLTYAGHEFLDSAREDKLWNKAKETVLRNAGTLTVESLKIALSLLMQQAARG